MKKYILLIICFLLFCGKIIIISIIGGIDYNVTTVFLLENNGIPIFFTFLIKTIHILFLFFIIGFYKRKGAKDEAWKLNKIFMRCLVILFIIQFMDYILSLVLVLFLALLFNIFFVLFLVLFLAIFFGILFYLLL